MRDFKPIRKLKEPPIAKNKNLSAVLITDDNVQEIEKETQAFSVFKNKTLLVGVMSFQNYPVWMICINPKSSKNKKYTFESDGVFQKYFEVIENPELLKENEK